MDINEKLLERNLEYCEGPNKKKGLQDKRTHEKIIEASQKNGFNSLLPSRRNSQVNLPIVATYNKYGKYNTIERGVMVLRQFRW